MSSAIIQEYGDKSYVVDEIILESAVAKNAVVRIELNATKTQRLKKFIRCCR